VLAAIALAGPALDETPGLCAAFLLWVVACAVGLRQSIRRIATYF
jgi:hypothetical protein